jgi:hypothetical protein
VTPPRRRDRHALEARRVQAKTWLVIAVIWVVLAAVVMFDDDLHPAVRTLLVLTGAGQAVAGAIWWRSLQEERRRDG